MKVNRRDNITIELTVREAWLLRDLLFDLVLSSTGVAKEYYDFAARFHTALKANLVDTKPPEIKG